MKHYQMKIELLSDLCVSDGGVYNSALDIDVAYDVFGFPYIPAKRLRGCLRECAQELIDWGIEGSVEDLFGEAGKIPNIRIGNAYLEHIESKKEEVLNAKGNLIFHQQNVLNYFTSIRTQTSIDYESGVAQENSLRTMRVVNKGEVFYADVELEDRWNDFFIMCCKTLRNIGVSRTRGLGEIKISLFQVEKKEQLQVKDCIWNKDADCLKYTIFLEEPVICRSIQNGEIKTLDYIEGNKILGLIAQQLKEGIEKELENKKFQEFCMNGDLKCTNAYPSYQGVRMSEVPACYYTIKNNKIEYVNKAYEEYKTKEREEEEKSIQLNSMKHCYIHELEDNYLYKYNVEIEKRYHHRRPEDKSISRAVETEKDSNFYQISSIAGGQHFTGFIYGEKEQIAQLYQILKKTSIKYIGTSKNSEYGKVLMESLIAEKCKEQVVIKEKKYSLLVKLEAPAIVYSENAMYSVDVDDLIKEVNAVLGLGKDDKPKKKYVNYTSIGGFNVTWGCRKPILNAFDKGTVLIYELNKEIIVPAKKLQFLGERNEEGYGEISIKKLEENGYLGKIYKNNEKKSITKLLIEEKSFAKKICDNLFEEFIHIKASEKAKEYNITHCAT